MNSGWLAEVGAIVAKEWTAERRSRYGLMTAGLFSLLSVVAIGFAAAGQPVSGQLAAGLLCVTLLFASVLTLPRTFLAEEEQGTFELLRLVADPTRAFLGKLIYNLVQVGVTALVLGVLFANFTGVPIVRLEFFVLGLLGEAIALASAVSLCGALAIGAANRWVMVATLAMPLLLPQVALGVAVLRVGFGQGTVEGGWQSLIGLFGFAIASLASGPALVGYVWRDDR